MARGAAATMTKARLSEDEVAAYHRDGVVVPRWRLPPDLLARMRGSLEELIARNPGVRPEMLLGPHIARGQNSGLVGHPDFLGYALMDDVLDMVEQLIGSDFLLWGSQVIDKPSGDGWEVPWHQDGQYWPIRPLATCTVSIALHDSLPENGCLRVIPGSHRGRELRPHHVSSRDGIALNQELDAGAFDEAEARDVALEAGQISLHDVYILHGSRPNRSTRRRTVYITRYMPTTSHWDRSFTRLNQLGKDAASAVNFAERPLWLARGIDRCGLNDFAIGHPT